MTILFLLFTWGCSGDLVVEGPWRVVLGQEAFCMQRIDRPSQQTSHQVGTLMAINADGLLFQNAGQWHFLSEKGTHPLPDPGQRPILSRLGTLKGPVFQSQTHLVALTGGVWREFPLELFVEYRPPNQVPASQFGLNLIFPQLLDQSGGDRWMYQPKSGVLKRYSETGKLLKEMDFGKHRRAIRVGTRTAWMGAPSESKISLTPESDLTQWLDHVSISDLNKHSLRFQMPQGCWVFTFPSGIRDGLKSWDSGTLPIKAHYLTATQEDLSLTSVSLGNLPLSFHLTTSASGSPRLEVEPEFRVTPVAGTEAVVIETSTQSWVLDPVKGLRDVRLAHPKTAWIGFVRDDRDLGGYDAEGTWKICLKDGF